MIETHALPPDESARAEAVSTPQYTYRMTVAQYLRYLAEADDGLDHSADLANVIAVGGRWVVNTHHSHSASDGDGFVLVRTAVEIRWL